MPLRSPRQHGLAGLGDAGAADPEQADEVRVGAEAAVADADAELGAQPGGDQRVVHPGHDEGGHGEGVGARRRAEHGDAVDGAQPVMELAGQRPLVRLDGVPADALELVHRRAEGHRTDHVGRTRLLALGRFGPDHLVEVDQVHRPAAGQERITLGEGAARPDQRTGPEGRVELVPAEGDVVGPRREGAVRGELGRIEQDGDAALGALRRRSPRPGAASR